MRIYSVGNMDTLDAAAVEAAINAKILEIYEDNPGPIYIDIASYTRVDSAVVPSGLAAGRGKTVVGYAGPGIAETNELFLQVSDNRGDHGGSQPKVKYLGDTEPYLADANFEANVNALLQDEELFPTHTTWKLAQLTWLNSSLGSVIDALYLVVN